MTTWRSTEFWQASFAQVSGLLLVWTGHLSGGEYVALSTIALGIYAGARTIQKRDE